MRMIRNFESARHFRIESHRNRLIRIRIEASQVPRLAGRGGPD